MLIKSVIVVVPTLFLVNMYHFLRKQLRNDENSNKHLFCHKEKVQTCTANCFDINTLEGHLSNKEVIKPDQISE